MKIKSEVVLKKGPHGWEAWQTNKLIAKVHGFDENAKEEVIKHIPGYENVIESGVKGMNTNSINRLIEKETGLRKSQKIIDYTRDSGSGNIAYRLNRVERWRNGDFHVAKYYQNTYDVIFDNVDARKKGADVIAALENAGCTNIIDNAERGFIKFDIPVGEKVMNGYERNADSVNKIFSTREIKSGLFSYTLEDVRDSINRYLERNVINQGSCKSNNPKEAEDVKKALLDLRENINNAIENGASVNEDTIYQVMNVCKKILWDRNYLQLLQDIINPLFESIGGNVPDTTELYKTVNNKKSFTPEEIDSLYEGIVNTGDDRFYKWLYETYPWITQDNAVTMNLEDFMLQWIYNIPGIYEEMREWLDYWKDE